MKINFGKPPKCWCLILLQTAAIRKIGNKEQLVAEACRYAISDTIALLQKAADQEKQVPKINAIIDYYLSAFHRDRTEMGCILPALSSEISRSSDEVHLFKSPLAAIAQLFHAAVNCLAVFFFRRRLCVVRNISIRELASGQ
jgi:AcrR family transcriptional regulator